MPTDARRLEGYSDISEQVLAEMSIYREVTRNDVLVNADATSMKVYVNELSTIATYVPGTGVSLSADGSAYVTVNNNAEDAINEILDGYTVDTAPADYVMSRFMAAVAARGEANDTKVLSGMVSEGTEDFAAAAAKPTVSTIYRRILDLKQNLDDVKAPRRNRVLILTPEMENLLWDVDSKLVLDTNRGDRIQSEAWIGRVLGFDIYSTTLLPSGTNMIAAHKRGYAAEQVYKVDPKIQDISGSAQFIGDSAVQDRVTFLDGAIRPTLIRVDNSAA